MDSEPNRVICPTCGEVRLETPEGTRALPTFGLAMKAARGPSATCDCGRRVLDEDGNPIGPRPADAPGRAAPAPEPSGDGPQERGA